MLGLIDIVLFIPIAFSVGYIFIFSIISIVFPKKEHSRQHNKQHRFLVVFPAYAEDNVIEDSIVSFLRQDYPNDLYEVVVVSDHMKDSTNAKLKSLPITTLIATYDNSSKAKALQLTVRESDPDFDYVVILDADNKVEPTFLTELNTYCLPESIAIQAHRKAKNTNNNVAILDAASEEINNTIFRKAHNQIGLSSALIGSGMCIDYPWFKNHVGMLSTAGEDKELEEGLLIEGKKVKYIEQIPVYDEKVQNGANFGNQRKRWIAAQIYSLKSLGKKLPQAIQKRKIDFVDKFIQQLLLPRSMCIVFTPLLTVIFSLLNVSIFNKWLILCCILFFSLFISIPRQLYNKNMLKAIFKIPGLVLRMLANLLHLKGASNTFIHTEHGVKK